MTPDTLDAIGKDAGAHVVALAAYDYARGDGFSHQGDRWFHAASTIKLAVLMALFDAVEAGRFGLEQHLHVRNRFRSAAGGDYFAVSADRDANPDVYRRLGLTLRLSELAYHMITTSSNLATNLLIDLIGVDDAQASLAKRGIEGIELVRGVEDEQAWEAGLNNRVTADGLVALLRAIHERDGLSDDAGKAMMDILFDQQFRSGIPAGLPDDARVGHKTGEISTVAHDAGLIFLPDREPYALAILTEWDADAGNDRRATIARLSQAVYDHFATDTADA